MVGSQKKGGYAKCLNLYHPHFIYIFIYIDWVVRTGIRIELFMFSLVFLFTAFFPLALLKYSVCMKYVCLQVK